MSNWRSAESIWTGSGRSSDLRNPMSRCAKPSSKTSVLRKWSPSEYFTCCPRYNNAPVPRGSKYGPYTKPSLFLSLRSVDIVVSNCVINLAPDKAPVFREIARVLKPGAELYFSDVYTDRRVPAHLQKDKVGRLNPESKISMLLTDHLYGCQSLQIPNLK